WDLSDDTTLEWGLSGATGANDVESHTDIYGTDVTVKWRPAQGGKYHALIWASEFMNGQKNLNPDGYSKTRGGYSLLQGQAAERWWVQARTEYVETYASAVATTDIQRKHSALIAFVPTEFSGWRLQYDHLTDGRDTPEQKVSLQLNITIGAHPAHA